MTVTWGQIFEALDISTRGIWPLWTTRSSDPSGTWLGLDQEPLRHFITSCTCYIVYFSLHSAHMDTLCLQMLPVVFVYMESLSPSRTPCLTLLMGGWMNLMPSMRDLNQAYQQLLCHLCSRLVSCTEIDYSFVH